ncbi:unnamed protein product [[Candida] boidinii]|uniref:Unnamed protein product n=1 Tax=Candida boidinii TaxID=5477 RepID=A0ACB5UAG9_CANBO|nr:unnamed protein product [[Candida] boidinii]GMF87246.1 unnamed protein product [[Candida] boidinii]
MDSFNLYGRPKRLNADKSDINSLLFALPVLPKVHYLQIEDLMGLVSSPSTLNWSPNDWSRAIKEILKVKISKGYDGCISNEGAAAASSLSSRSRSRTNNSGNSNSSLNSPVLSSSQNLRSFSPLSDRGDKIIR